jgi:hypothetical protein
MALGPTQSPIQGVPGALSLGVKRPRRKADHSPAPSAEVKECMELYFHSPNMPSWRGAQLKHRDTFTFFYLYSPIRHMINNSFPQLATKVTGLAAHVIQSSLQAFTLFLGSHLQHRTIVHCLDNASTQNLKFVYQWCSNTISNFSNAPVFSIHIIIPFQIIKI